MIDTNDFVSEFGEYFIKRVANNSCSQMTNMEVLGYIRGRVVDTDCFAFTLFRVTVIIRTVILINDLMGILSLINIKIQITANDFDFAQKCLIANGVF